MIRPALVAFTLPAMLALAGCTTRTAAYPERSPEIVWTAMKVAVAEPRYDDWVVVENEYYADEALRRIDVMRHLRRDLYGDGKQPWREDETFKFRISLGETKQGVPEVTFVSRDWAVPAHAWIEADRYFAEMTEILKAADRPLGTVAPSAP